MKIKPKIFKSKFADIKVIVYEGGYIAIMDKEEMTMVTLGRPPNARIDLILEAIKYARGKK